MVLERAKVAVYKRLPRALQKRAIRYGTPNFTVGTMAMLTDDGTRLLLVRPTYRRGWLPPGGFIGRGETPIETLHRELREELDVTAAIAEPHRVYFDVRRQALTYVCVAVLNAGQTPRLVGPELSDLAWYPLEALPPMPEDFHEGIHDEDVAAVRSARVR